MKIYFYNLRKESYGDSTFDKFFHPAVNFINVERTNFSYETSFWQLFSSDMYVKKRRSYEKFVRLTLMKLTTGWLCHLCHKITPTHTPTHKHTHTHSLYLFHTFYLLVTFLSSCFFSLLSHTIYFLVSSHCVSLSHAHTSIDEGCYIIDAYKSFLLSAFAKANQKLEKMRSDFKGRLFCSQFYQLLSRYFCAKK